MKNIGLHSLTALGYLSWTLLGGGCARFDELSRRSREKERTQAAPEALPSALTHVLATAEALGKEVMAVNVVDHQQLGCRLLAREQFYLLQEVDPEVYLFHHVQVESTAELEDLFRRLAALPDYLGKVSVASMPDDLDTLPIPRKKEVFLEAMLPLVTFYNGVIRAQRERLEVLKGDRELTSEERLFVEKMGQDYRLDRCLKPLSSLADTLQALLLRVDQIPPSLVLAQAAIESGWGTAEASRRTNNLFGEQSWEVEIPHLPLSDCEPRFCLAFFPTIGSSVRSYLRNLNTHPAYEEFRWLRQQQRRRGRPLDPLILAEGLQPYSIQGEEYVRYLIHFILANDLRRFDELLPPPA